MYAYGDARMMGCMGLMFTVVSSASSPNVVSILACSFSGFTVFVMTYQKQNNLIFTFLTFCIKKQKNVSRFCTNLNLINLIEIHNLNNNLTSSSLITETKNTLTTFIVYI